MPFLFLLSPSFWVLLSEREHWSPGSGGSALSPRTEVGREGVFLFMSSLCLICSCSVNLLGPVVPALGEKLLFINSLVAPTPPDTAPFLKEYQWEVLDGQSTSPQQKEGTWIQILHCSRGWEIGRCVWVGGWVGADYFLTWLIFENFWFAHQAT